MNMNWYFSDLCLVDRFGSRRHRRGPEERFPEAHGHAGVFDDVNSSQHSAWGDMAAWKITCIYVLLRLISTLFWKTSCPIGSWSVWTSPSSSSSPTGSAARWAAVPPIGQRNDLITLISNNNDEPLYTFKGSSKTITVDAKCLWIR